MSDHLPRADEPSRDGPRPGLPREAVMARLRGIEESGRTFDSRVAEVAELLLEFVEDADVRVAAKRAMEAR